MACRIWFSGFVILLLSGVTTLSGQFREYDDPGNVGIVESYILSDSGRHYSESDIVGKNMDSLFLPLLQHSSLEAGNSYWIRFKIFNTTNFNHWLLEMRPKFRKAELYIPDSRGGYTRLENGLDVNYDQWPIPYTNLLFPIPSSGENEWFYLYIETDYSIGIGLLAVKYNTFIKRSIPEYQWHGMFFGIIAVATLFSLIFFFKLNEKAYLFYALYVVSFALFALVDWGMVVKFLTWSGIPWHKDLYTIPFSGMTIFLLLYARSLMETRKYSKPVDTAIIIAVIARLFIYFTGTLFDLDGWYNPSIDNILLFVSFIAAIVRAQQGYFPARYLLVGLSVLYLGLIVHSLQNRGLLPYNMLPFFSMYKTGIIEMVFFSLALADRFRIMKQEQDLAHMQTIRYLKENSELQQKIIFQLNENEILKDQVNRELEQKVLERTKELQEANNVIVEINHFLEDSNLKLAGEVRKISINRVMQKTVTFEEFKEIYPDEESCYIYLEKMKWSSGFVCRKCGYEKYSPGNTPYSRRCSRCNYIERITSNTIFSNIKFPVSKAFYMLFLVNTGKNFTIDKLSEILDLRKQTVWYFKKKILNAMKYRRIKGNMEEGWSRWILDRAG